MLNGSSPETRGQAQAAVRRSLDQGGWPSPRDAWDMARDLPRESLDDLRVIRNLDLAHPVQQMRANTSFRPLSLMGEAEAAVELNDLRRIHPMIRGSHEVSRHLSNAETQLLGVAGARSAGLGLYAVELTRLFTVEPTAAARLHLEDGR